ncbi:glycoside hydrolase family 3 N-terminal domain-containing protein [Streptomyces sp. NRRL F-5126]|uniref:glycoside hydrolase family 3 N-terminal domain-containing protein n=1 Tax=Streptomyces sp. NRRL F-5126 TaxID=1463857 RepID=UPI00056AEC3F|nr:glycoside hydrolase family 3 N-terminal domain-containing protein [Streptomyces sp. NRRL F-5126]
MSGRDTAEPPLYRDPSASVADRVADLLGRMTLAEKAGQVNQRMYGWHAYERTPSGFRLTDAFRAEVDAFGGMGALYGLQRADPWSGVTFADGVRAEDAAELAAAVQRHVAGNTRLGIPVLMVEEVPHGHQALDGTVLPVNLAVGASWDPALYEEAAHACAAQLRARGGHVALVSALDLVRDPRWGRTEECFGEDPYLAARFTEALVRGMQGDVRGGNGRGEGDGRGDGTPFAPDRAAVVLKHFAGQGSTVGGRNSPATELGARELHEIHLPAARAGVRAGAAGLMAAYNEFDGLPCAASRPLLTELLRERWKFDGIVMADGRAVDRLVRLAGDEASAAALALEAGTDMGLWDDCFPRLVEAVERGLVAEDVLDTAVARVLTLKFRLGLFDGHATTATTTTETPGGVPTARAREASEALARACVVLLEHDESTLPFGDRMRSLAVLGPNADSVPQQIGDYTAPQPPGSGTTVLEGIRAAAPAGVRVTYGRGSGLVSDDDSALPEAVRLAAEADAAVLVLGGSSAREPDTRFEDNGAAVVGSARPAGMTSGEGVDLADLALPAGQRALLDAVAATGTPVVVVLVQGRPHALDDLSGRVGALLSAWYPGPWGGAAVGEILFGRVAPSGRLPVSVPRSAAALPVHYNAKDHGYRGYVDQPATARYPFGHGLSYTTVEYGEPRLSRERVTTGDPVTECTVRVANTGGRAVRETVQLYIRRLSGGTSWPRVRELRDFLGAELAPGEHTDVVFRVDAHTLESVTRGLEREVEAGEVEIEVGSCAATARGVRLVVEPA